MPGGKDEARDIGNLGARARQVQGTAASKKLEDEEEGVSATFERTGVKLKASAKGKVPDPPPKPKASSDAIFDYFMKVGADYKGQVQSCYDILGKAVEGTVSIDPGQIFLPGTTCEINASVKASNSDALLITMTVGPTTDVAKPMCFATMAGAHRSMAVTLGAEVGFKAPEVLPEVPDNLAEVASWELEAKATVQASVGYTGEYQHVSDPAPRFYTRDEVRSKLREDFARVRSGETNKAKAKHDACMFCNANQAMFGKVNYKSFFGGHVGSSKLIGILDKGILAIFEKARKEKRAPNGPEERLMATALQHRADLQPYLEDFPFREYCSLRMWGHRGDAGASVTASAKFEAKLEVPTASAEVGVEATATLVDVKGSIKHTVYRYQTLCHLTGTSGAKQQLVATQDTKITYKQAELDALKVEAKAGAKGKAFKHEGEAEVGAELQPEWGNQVYNAISYVSGTVYWFPEGTGAPKVFEKGSGYSFGQSVDFENFLRLATFDDDGNATLKDDTNTAAYLQALSERLKVTVEQLTEFMRDGALAMCACLQFDPNATPEALLIESSFFTAPTIAFRKDFRNKTTNQLADFRDAMIRSQEQSHEWNLEAIRLRYRIADTTVRDEVKFKLGFKLLGTGAGIALHSVDRAGSEGIVDLTTTWFNGLARYNARGQSQNGYEYAVPPVALLHQ